MTAAADAPAPKSPTPSPVRRRRSRTRRVVKQWLDQIVSYGLLGLLALTPLVGGGVHTGTGFAVAVFGMLLGALAMLRHTHARVLRTPAALALVGLVGLTTLQLIPWPLGLVDLFNSRTATLYANAQRDLGLDPSWAYLSLSPPRSAFSLWQLLGVTGVFVASALHFRHWDRFAWFVPRLLVVGVVFAMGVAVQTSLGGLSLTLKAPLVNINHAAVLLGASSLLALGVAWSRRIKDQRYTFILLYLALALVMILTLSRGALLAWVAAHVMWLVAMRGGALRQRTVLATLVAGLLLVGVAGLWLGHRALLKEWSSTVGEFNAARAFRPLPHDSTPPDVAGETASDPLTNEALDTPSDSAPPATDESTADTLDAPLAVSKLLIINDVSPMLSDFALTGIGRGAFAEVFPIYAHPRTPGTFVHAENDWLELILEMGWPGAGLIILALTMAFVGVASRNNWRDNDRPLVAGLLMVVMCIALQNLVDFSFRVPAIAMFAATCFGALVARHTRYTMVLEGRRRERKDQAPNPPLSKPARVLNMVVGVVLVGGLLSALLHTPEAIVGSERSDVTALHQRVQGLADGALDDPAATRQALLDQAKPALLRRPADGYLRFLLGVGLLRTGGVDGAAAARPWLERALALHRSDPRIQLSLAATLITLGERDEAVALLRDAAQLHRGPSSAVYRLAAVYIQDLETLKQTLSKDPADRRALGLALLQAERFNDTLDLAFYFDTTYPESPVGLELQLRALAALRFPEAALAPAEELVRRFSTQPKSYVRLVDLHRTLKQPKDAHRVLLEGLERHPKDDALLFRRIHLLLQHGSIFYPDERVLRQEIEQAINVLRPVALAKREARPAFFTLRGEFFVQQGDHRQAKRAFQRVVALQPKNLGPRLRLFETLLSLGDVEQAEGVLTDIKRMTKSSKRVAQLQAKLEARRAQLRRLGFRRRGLSPRSLPPMPGQGEGGQAPVQPAPPMGGETAPASPSQLIQ